MSEKRYKPCGAIECCFCDDKAEHKALQRERDEAQTQLKQASTDINHYGQKCRRLRTAIKEALKYCESANEIYRSAPVIEATIKELSEVLRDD